MPDRDREIYRSINRYSREHAYLLSKRINRLDLYAPSFSLRNNKSNPQKPISKYGGWLAGSSRSNQAADGANRNARETDTKTTAARVHVCVCACDGGKREQEGTRERPKTLPLSHSSTLRALWCASAKRKNANERAKIQLFGS